ncbi:class I SAM-dependent methyltransferase [Paenibacillus sp. HJGM_3]|uniref:class I SAM-dependent methyltransferase n=1 Tax=Paenibacillus sp. HJGM_3 TaxID=3379816 RepID=UPI00385BA91B
MLKVILKIYELYEYNYLWGFGKGLFRMIHLKKLRKKYNFEEWHTSPKEFRPYTLDLIKYINDRISMGTVVVEIGCGLGEIISNIRCNARYGLDISPRVIQAAIKMDQSNKNPKVVYRLGTFEDIQNLDIEYLIAVNFTQSIDSQSLRDSFAKICNNNNINNIIVDDVPNYKFIHDFDTILPSTFKLTYTSKPYNYGRKILIYSRGG